MALTEHDRSRSKALLHALFPGRIPAETAEAWIACLADRDAADVAHGIKAMAETADFPSLKALRDAVIESAHERCRAENEAANAKRLAAWSDSGIDLESSRAKLGRIAAAVRRRAPREEIETIASEGVKR